ncbi:MAG TPA: YCF48-related protein [Woeseiaceae bacterium]|nr:YCF48-related protein [Woeseiaceae bacterium]
MLHKAIACSTLLLLAAAPAAMAQSPGWSVALDTKHPHADTMRSVQFLTRHVGWAVGDSYEGFTCIHRTVDGGRTWERLELFDGAGSPTDFSVIRFADARHGWIAPRGGKLVLRTVDGGESWIPTEMREVDHVQANDMLTMGTEGLVIAADGGMIHRTFDGGETWIHSAILTQHGLRLGEKVMALAVAPPSALFAVTKNTSGPHGGIWRSDDGGATWQPVLETDQGLTGIAFGDASNGVAVGKDIAYWTDDGGARWQRAIAPGYREDVEQIDASTFVAVGYNPGALVSSDGGRTWRAAGELHSSISLTDVDVVDGGWWFATADHPQQVFHWFDPDVDALLAEGTITLPSAITLGGERSLPPGEYEVMAGHAGYDHGLALSLVEPAEGVETGVEAEQLAENQYACDPCEFAMPLDVEYEIQESGMEAEESGLGFRLEPTSDGLAIALDARFSPPEDAVGLLAVIGVSEEMDVDVRQAAEESSGGGGLFGRLRKAASGDLGGAVAGVDPAAAADRAQSAEALPPAYYHVVLRFPLSLIPQAEPEGG